MPYKDLLKGRASLPNHIYHVTMVTYNRQPIFSQPFAADICATELQTQTDITSLAWVIMPDHIHWLFQLKENELSSVIKSFKGRTAIAINHTRQAKGSVWQKSFHDHALRQDEDVKTVARYIVANPLRAGLVNDIYDYRYWWAVWLDNGDFEPL